MEFLIIGVFTAFNFIVLKIKLERRRYGDFTLDLLAIVILIGAFGQTLGGMIIAMVASLIISTYLLYNPPKIRL